jgi:hypothetical protein
MWGTVSGMRGTVPQAFARALSVPPASGTIRACQTRFSPPNPPKPAFGEDLGPVMPSWAANRPLEAEFSPFDANSGL